MINVADQDYMQWLNRLDEYRTSGEAEDMAYDEPFNEDSINPAEDVTENISVITKSMCVDGNITSSASMSVSGRVNGNIKTDADLGVSGIVVGDIKGKNISYNHAGVRGNTKAEESVTLENDTAIIGDINAHDVTIEGKVKGKVRASGSASIRSNTLAIGSIEAGRIQIEDGARINASISIIDDPNTKAEQDFTLEV